MKIEHLKYMIKIVEEGSMSKAANTLFVTQPYLSKVVQEVEEKLNFRVFDRSNRGIKMTEKGSIFISQANQLLRQYESLLNINLDMKNKTEKFSISMVRSSLVMGLLIELIDKWKDHENIEFNIMESDSLTTIENLMYNKADIAVIYSEKTSRKLLIEELAKKNITYEKICKIQPSIILGSKHPLLNNPESIKIDDLYDFGYVGYTNRQYPYYFKHTNIDIVQLIIDYQKIKKAIFVDNRASYHNILTQTNFFTIGTQAAKRQEELFNMVSIPIKDPSYDNMLEMAILTRNDNMLKPITESFIQLLKESYSDIST